jgi:hypothetical protein
VSHYCVALPVSPASASVYIISGLFAHMFEGLLQRGAEILSRLLVQLNHRYIIAECVYDQQPCAVFNRLPDRSGGVALLHLLSLPQVAEEEQVRLVLLGGSAPTHELNF